MAAPCGIDLPMSYGSPATEHRAVCSQVGLIDRSYSGVVEVTEKDRAGFLQGMLTNDVKRLGPGQGCAAAFLDGHGKVQALLSVLALDDRFLLILPGGAAPRVLELLDRFLFSERVSLREASGETAKLMLAGPAAASLIRDLAGAGLPHSEWHHVEATINGIPVRVVRGGDETGAPEAWILSAPARAAELWEAALSAGATPVGLTAFDALRVEAGTAWYGHDVDDTVLLPEIPAAPLVSDTKGCYIGQEVVVRIRDRGHVNRALTGLALDGEDVPPAGASVSVGDDAVGRVTSAVWSFSLSHPIALAFVRRQHSAPGTLVTVLHAGRALAARVVSLPFVGRA